MEVAVMGSRAKLGTKEGGKLNQLVDWNGVKRNAGSLLEADRPLVIKSTAIQDRVRASGQI